MLRTHVTKEAVNGAQSDVAGAGLAAAFYFQMLKERQNAFWRYGLDFQAAGGLRSVQPKTAARA